jgi:hypothetical protein
VENLRLCEKKDYLPRPGETDAEFRERMRKKHVELYASMTDSEREQADKLWAEIEPNLASDE